MIASGQWLVVAGNGPSVANIAPGRVLAEDVMIRTNNFFFEDRFWLGSRVDLAFIGGDPRVAPFLFETLYRHGADYQFGRWSSQHPTVIRAGQRRFAPRYVPMRYRDNRVRTEVEALMAKYQRKPMTGTLAVLMAHGLGADRIVLAGLDLYHGDARYVYQPGRNYRALMGSDGVMRQGDCQQHHIDLDRAILTMLGRRDDLRLMRAADSAAVNDILPLAPVRPGAGVVCLPRQPPKDWVARSGLYPISFLKTLRRASELRRHFLKGA